jgi:SAM-dependent methyltransferase
VIEAGLRRAIRRWRHPSVTRDAAAGGDRERYDSWLETFFAEPLARIDGACGGAGPEALKLFRELDSHLWGLLLTQQYECFPAIKALLPDVPDVGLQATWNGATGARLAAQGVGFYDTLRLRYAQHSRRELADSRVLDFGCGWGRLTRWFARDVEPENLFGCDPVQPILDVCRRTRVPATLARSEFVPRRLPFAPPFDLAYAFSVFTHLSEPAHEASLRALHAGLAPGGLLVVTIRPPDYLRLSELLAPVLASLGPGLEDELRGPRYLFAPHAGQPLGAQAPGGEITYGETVVTMAYVRRQWSERFELLDVDLLLDDPYQVMLTLRAR